jgi:hypothetical protein
MTSRRMFLSAIGILGLAAAAPGSTQEVPQRWAAAARERLGSLEHSLHRLALPGSAKGKLTAALTFEGEALTLDLVPARVRAEDFRVYAAESDGRLVSLAAPPPSTLRGVVRERPDVVVSASLVDGRLHALLHSGEEPPLVLEPLASFLPGAPRSLHVLFRPPEDDGLAIPCGVEGIEELLRGAPTAARWPAGRGLLASPADQTAGDSLAAAATASWPWVAEIALEADRELWNKRGQNDAAVVADLERVMNDTNNIYQRDVFIRHQITTIVIRHRDDYVTSDDACTYNAGFTSYWNYYHSGIKRDVAHLMSGLPHGSYGGCANLSTLCDRSWAYSMSYNLHYGKWDDPLWYYRRPGVLAHELGHNWGSGHCDSNPPCHLMCSQVDKCNGEYYKFGPWAQGQIANFRNSRTCLGSFQYSDCVGVNYLLQDLGLASATCAAYCASLGRTCSNTCTTNRGYNNWGVEAWINTSNCEAYTTSGGQVGCTTNLANYSNHGERKYRCCC